jgi:hypothetical protein
MYNAAQWIRIVAPGSRDKQMNSRTELDCYKVDRSAVEIIALTDSTSDREYWLSRTPEDRWEALELLRRINYGAAATGRLKRVLTVARLKRS